MTYQDRPQQTIFYHENVLKLARSLILKSDATAFHMNDVVDEFYHSRGINKSVDKQDPSTWRYYLHLQGKYHEYDLMTTGVLRVVSLDTLQTIDFTRENLLQHKATLGHYKSRGEYYQQLISQYPDMHVLIDGICRPLDYETCFKADDYRILSYDETLVEDQEIELIGMLDEHIQQAVYAYHSHNYSVFHDHYDALKLGVLATQLPGMIIAIREQFVHTGQAHSYHIWTYLASYFELDRYRQYLTFEQAMWLYRHIRYIDINGGRQDTFDELIKWLLTKRNIPLYGFDIENSGDRVSIIRTKENMHDVKNELDDTNLDLASLYDKEHELGSRNTVFRNRDLDNTNNAFDKSVLHNRQTKLLESVVNDYSAKEIYPLEVIGANYWCYLACTKKYNIVGSLTNPTNGEIFTVDAKEGFILWMYLTSKLLNDFEKSPLDNIKITDFTCRDILSEHVDWERVERNLVNKKYYIRNTLQDFAANYPNYRHIFSAEGFREFITEIRDYRLYLRQSWSWFGDKNIMNEVKHVAYYLHINPNFVLSDDDITFGQFIEYRNWDFDKLTREQVVELAHRIYSFFTGGDLKITTSVEETQKAMLAILKQLSSYSIQFVSQVLGENQRYIEVPYVGVAKLGSLQKHLYKIYQHWVPKYYRARAQEKDTIIMQDIIRDSQNSIRAHEIDRIILPSGITPRIQGRTMTMREVRMPACGWKAKGSGRRYYRQEMKSEYYVYQNTLYRRHSHNEQEKAYFQMKTGKPVNDTRQ